MHATEVGFHQPVPLISTGWYHVRLLPQALVCCEEFLWVNLCSLLIGAAEKEGLIQRACYLAFLEHGQGECPFPVLGICACSKISAFFINLPGHFILNIQHNVQTESCLISPGIDTLLMCESNFNWSKLRTGLLKICSLALTLYDSHNGVGFQKAT